MKECRFCKEEYTCDDPDVGYCDYCWFELGMYMHDQLWVFEETAIEYGWTKETSPIAVIDPTDKIWQNSEHDWVKEEA